MTSFEHHNPAFIFAHRFFITLIFSFLLNTTFLYASPEAQHQEVQQGNDLQEALRPNAAAASGPAQEGFGDSTGILPIGDTQDWERQASAAGLTDEGFYETGGKQNKEQFDGDLSKINEQDAERLAAEQAAQDLLDIQNIRVFTEEIERRERLAALDKESLNRKREMTSAATRRFVEKAQADGKWTADEWERYDELYEEEMKAWELTPEEQDKMNEYNDMRNGVVDEIRRSALGMGGLSEQEVADRAQAANMTDAATKTWRNITFTGRMVNEVGKDITAQRELGIKANNTMIAAQLYMQRTDISDEQRQAAQQIYDQAHFARGAAADAISKDGALIMLGVASDVAVLGVGRPVSFVAGKIGGGIRSAWNGVFGGTEAAAGAAGAEAGAALGNTAGATGRAAGTEAGTAAGAAGRTAGAETGAATGAAGRAGGEAGAAGEGAAGLKPSQMTPAQRQAYHDAKAQQATSEAWRSGKTGSDGGSGVLPPPPGYTPPPAVGELSKGLTQAEINALFKPGANLTAEQIGQKADLLLTGYRPPVVGGPAPSLPGVVAGAADDAATVILPPGQGVVTGAAAEAGTVLTGAGGRGAAAGGTQAFNGAVTLPPPGASTTGAAGATTIINPAPAASSQAGTIITGAGGRGAAEAAAGGSTTIITPAGQGIGVSSQAGTIITGQGGRGAAQATGGTTIIERGAGR